jgi:poly(A) polymerase
MLTTTTRGAAWEMLWGFALVDVIFRLLPSREGVEFERKKSLFLRLSPDKGVSFGLALAAGVLDYRMQGDGVDPLPFVGRKEIQRAGRAMREALKISNEELEEMVGILEPIEGLLGPAAPGVAGKKRFLARPTAGGTRELLRAVAELGVHVERVSKLEGEVEELLKGEVAPVPLITGDDLVAEGFKPGPVFKRILDAVYDAQLEGRVGTREEALRMSKNVKT